MFGAAIPLGIVIAGDSSGLPPPPPPPPGEAYPNGYLFRRTMHIPAGTFSADHGQFILLFHETDSVFRSVANGGNVESDDGWDIRFEASSGAKLSHDLERYDPVAGEIVAWVGLPASVGNSFTGHVYYGNPDIDASEAAPGVLWAPYLAVYHLPSLSEAGGRVSRDLSPVGTVATDDNALIGPSMSLAGTGLLKVDGVAWLDNLSALTIQVIVRPD